MGFWCEQGAEEEGDAGDDFGGGFAGCDFFGQDCCASLPFGLPLAGCLPSVG
jgi:hypothetical protein